MTEAKQSQYGVSIVSHGAGGYQLQMVRNGAALIDERLPDFWSACRRLADLSSCYDSPETLTRSYGGRPSTYAPGSVAENLREAREG